MLLVKYGNSDLVKNAGLAEIVAEEKNYEKKMEIMAMAMAATEMAKAMETAITERSPALQIRSKQQNLQFQPKPKNLPET